MIISHVILQLLHYVLVKDTNFKVVFVCPSLFQVKYSRFFSHLNCISCIAFIMYHSIHV